MMFYEALQYGAEIGEIGHFRMKAGYNGAVHL